MNGVISGRDVVIVVASVLIRGGVTSDDNLVDETSMKGAITGGVDVSITLWGRLQRGILLPCAQGLVHKRQCNFLDFDQVLRSTFMALRAVASVSLSVSLNQSCMKNHGSTFNDVSS
ncbi:hypothetical protein Tco_1093636 [Tanacetum coccineum]|uniref:Uncharacterized protein n=1 Tax=Tanacetum coccineum TaxID=301880 RepID=A0ABQ5IDA1_9ASTR